MTDSRVVICGGGVIGCSVAYYLARDGVRATIIERDGVASGASGAAAGIITPPLPGAGAVEEIARRGFEMHRALARSLPSESGVSYRYRETSRVLLAESLAEERAARALALALRDRGPYGTWLGPHEISARTGWVDRAGRGGVLVEPPSQLDPYRFTLALLAASERGGAEVRAGSVGGIRSTCGRVEGVILEDETLAADVVILAAGPWSGEVGEWVGLPVPVEPLKGQIVKVRPASPVRDFCVGRGGNYAITKEDGLVYLGTTEERTGFDRSTSEAARDEILTFGVGLSSVLETAELVEQTACLRPLSADGIPIIGHVPGLAGAFIATGHGRQGILMAPPTGKAVADLVVRGHTDCIDLRPFEPSRFLRGS